MVLTGTETVLLWVIGISFVISVLFLIFRSAALKGKQIYRNLAIFFGAGIAWYSLLLFIIIFILNCIDTFFDALSAASREADSKIRSAEVEKLAQEAKDKELDRRMKQAIIDYLEVNNKLQ